MTDTIEQIIKKVTEGDPEFEQQIKSFMQDTVSPLKRSKNTEAMLTRIAQKANMSKSEVVKQIRASVQRVELTDAEAKLAKIAGNRPEVVKSLVHLSPENIQAMADVMEMDPISYRLGRYPKRIESFFGANEGLNKKRIDQDIFQLRVAVQNAPKFLLPVIGFSMSVNFRMAVSGKWEDAATRREFARVNGYLHRYRDFIRLPMETLVLENSTGAYYVHRDPRWPEAIVYRVMTHSMDNIAFSPLIHVFYPGEQDAEGFVKTRSFHGMKGYLEIAELLESEDAPNYYQNPVHRAALLNTMTVAEGLLLLNTANITLHAVDLPQADLKSIPAVLRGNYRYYALDLGRRFTDIATMADLRLLMNGFPVHGEDPFKVVETTRYKQVQDQLYVWNHAMRRSASV